MKKLSSLSESQGNFLVTSHWAILAIFGALQNPDLSPPQKLIFCISASFLVIIQIFHAFFCASDFGSKIFHEAKSGHFAHCAPGCC